MHNDLATPGNDVSTSGGVSPVDLTVLEWEFSHVGYRSADLLWVATDHPHHHAAFLDGYGIAGHAPTLTLLAYWRALAEVVAAAGYDFHGRPPCTCPAPMGRTPPMTCRDPGASAGRSARVP